MNNEVLEFRVSNLENAVLKIEKAVESIAASLQTLASLQAHHDTTREDLRDHEGRLRKLENDAPTARLVVKWVVAGVIGLCALFGVAMFQLMMSSKVPPAIPPVSHSTGREI